MLEDVIPMVVCTGMFAMIFGIVYIRSRENMAMIEKGLNPRQKSLSPRPYVNLKYGLLMIGSGMGLFIAYILDYFVMHRHAIEPVATATANTGSDLSIKVGGSTDPLYFGLIAIGGGIGLFLSYRIERKEWMDKKVVQE